MSPTFRGKCRQTHITCFIISLFRQCLVFVAKLYLSPYFSRREAIKSISVPRISGNYLAKSRFLVFLHFWEKLENNHQLIGCLYCTRISSHYESPQLKTVFLDLKRFEDLYLERMGNLWPLPWLFGL